jgi:uncharacterized membrane protein
MRKTWIAAALYACVFACLETYRWRIWSFGSDTGTFMQAVLDAPGGFRDGPEGGSHFYFHFSPILAALYPFARLAHSGLVLQIAQAVLVALSAPAVFALFSPYVPEQVAFRLALLALAYPPLAAIAFGEFHELAFFPVLAIGLLWAADRGRWAWFALFGTACLLTREDVCLELAVIGIGIAAFAMTRRNAEGTGLMDGAPRRPLETAAAFGIVAVVGAALAAAYYHAVFAAYGTWPHGHFYDYPFAHGPPAVLLALLTQPQIVLPAILTFGRFTYLLEALLPLVLLPLRSWWSALALPGFVVVLLASEQSVWRMGNHYAAMWAPWLLVGTGAALARIAKKRGTGAAAAWANGALVACVVTLVAFNPLHVGHYLTPPYGDLRSARAALACVPRGAVIATHDEWFAEIAGGYPHATIQATEGVTYLVYADDFPNDRFRQTQLPKLQADVASGRYSIICSYGRVKTYRRN